MTVWEWCDKLKLGKSSAFVKRDIRALPQNEAEFEADFFLDPKFSTKGEEAWAGAVIEREYGSVLALEDVPLPPPTVNNLASLLAHAMLRPPSYEDRQRPRTIHLRDRPQWQELLPHLRQLGIEVVLSEELPKFDEAVIEWIQKTEKPLSADKIRSILREPFPERERTLFTEATELMDWLNGMCKAAYPSRNNPAPPYDPETSVKISLTAGELDSILTKTDIAKTKKLRPRLEAMAAEEKPVELGVHDWSDVVSALCVAKAGGGSGRKEFLGLAKKIAGQLAQALGIEGPPNCL